MGSVDRVNGIFKGTVDRVIPRIDIGLWIETAEREGVEWEIIPAGSSYRLTNELGGGERQTLKESVFVWLDENQDPDYFISRVGWTKKKGRRP
ncbi:hypothetical protein M1116_01025 [Patescibacteria group bacterium]|nr:hypothetical protein [Patescibacteria group bacterium]